MGAFLHPFLNPYNLSGGQITFWVVLCCVIIPLLGTLVGNILKRS